jgi:uncharacterized protein YkwD
VSRRAVLFTGLLAVCLLAVSACRVSTPTATPIAPSHTPTLVSSSALTPSVTPYFVPTFPPLPTQTSPPATSTPILHAIQPGDTLLGLATTYGVPMAAIQLQNGMGESIVLYAGDVLVIPPVSGWDGDSRFWVVYVVKEGETLAEIAQTYDLEVEELAAINGLADLGELQPGDQLVLPLEAPAAAYLPTPTHTPTPIPPTSTVTPIPSTVLPVPTLAPAAPAADIADWPYETARLINEVRAAHGLPPYAYNETLAQAAQAHADDCVARGWCSHTGSDGSDVKARIIRAGYEPSSWAECWAQSRNPNHAVEMWMDETPPNDPHVRVLLSTWVTEIGVGVAQTTWGYYFIADFGRP